MPSAVELSAYVALVAVGLLAANLTLGLLMAAGFNPARHWPHRSLKLFRLHNWTGYIALTAALIHPAILLFSTSPPFRLIDLIVPVWSPVQPVSNVLGATRSIWSSSWSRHRIFAEPWDVICGARSITPPMPRR